MPDAGRLRARGPHPNATTPKRTIYISKPDRTVWEAADRFSKERGVSLASVVAAALARYLADPPKPEER